MSKKKYNEIKDSGKDKANVSSIPEDTSEARIIKAPGRTDNIETVTCCTNHFRIIVKDDSLTAPDINRKNYLEAIGIVRGKNFVQVIYGIRMVNIATKVKDYLHLD